jgi:hypothetical protein
LQDDHPALIEANKMETILAEIDADRGDGVPDLLQRRHTRSYFVSGRMYQKKSPAAAGLRMIRRNSGVMSAWCGLSMTTKGPPGGVS